MFCEGSQSSRSKNSSVTGQLDLRVVSGGRFITAVRAGEQLEEPHRGPEQQVQAQGQRSYA